MKTIKIQTTSGRKMTLKTNEAIKQVHIDNLKFLAVFYEMFIHKPLKYKFKKRELYSEVVYAIFLIMKSMVPEIHWGHMLGMIQSYYGEMMFQESTLGEWCTDENGTQVLFMENGYDLSRVWEVQKLVEHQWKSYLAEKDLPEGEDTMEYVSILNQTETKEVEIAE